MVAAARRHHRIAVLLRGDPHVEEKRPVARQAFGQGGVQGADGHLDNNDFVVFIDLFFNHSPIADVGSQGGVAGADGAWDNNDFIVFIDQFFAAPASCR